MPQSKAQRIEMLEAEMQRLTALLDHDANWRALTRLDLPGVAEGGAREEVRVDLLSALAGNRLFSEYLRVADELGRLKDDNSPPSIQDSWNPGRKPEVINGIERDLARALAAVGVQELAQLAAWQPEQAARVVHALALGRADRAQVWLDQISRLAGQVGETQRSGRAMGDIKVGDAQMDRKSRRKSLASLVEAEADRGSPLPPVAERSALTKAPPDPSGSLMSRLKDVRPVREEPNTPAAREPAQEQPARSERARRPVPARRTSWAASHGIAEEAEVEIVRRGGPESAGGDPARDPDEGTSSPRKKRPPRSGS